MSGQIFWSDKAKNDYRGILVYLTLKWSSKEIEKFNTEIERNISNIVSHPEIGAISKKKSIRRLVISKQTSLYYKNIHEDIYIIALFDNRQNPDKLKIL